MVSPEHIDEQKPEDQQAPTAVENKRAWLKRVLGVVVPLIGGIAITCLYIATIVNAPDFFYLGLLVAFFLGVVGALLFRSWWSILVIPIALTLGELLVVYLVSLLFFPNPIAVDDVGFGVFFNVIATNILAVFGTLFGTTIIKRSQESWLTKMPKDF